MARFSLFLLLGALLYFSVLVSGEEKLVQASAPVNLRTTSVQANIVKLAWDDGAVTCKNTLDGKGSLKTYSVSSSPSVKCTVVVAAGSPAKTASCTGLSENTVYSFTVKSLCNYPDGTEDPSSVDSDLLLVTTKYASPSATESVTVVSSGENKATVTFQPGEIGCDYFYGQKFDSWIVLEGKSPNTPLACTSKGENTLECSLPDYSGGIIAVRLKCTTLLGKTQYYPYDLYAQTAGPVTPAVKPTWNAATVSWTVDGVTCENSGSELDGYSVKVTDFSGAVLCEGKTNDLSFECNGLSSETEYDSFVTVVCKDNAKNSLPAGNLFTTYYATTLPVGQLSATKISDGVWEISFEDSLRTCAPFDKFSDDTSPSKFDNDLSIEVEAIPVDSSCTTISSAGTYTATCILDSGVFVEGKYHSFSVAYRCKNPDHDSVATIKAADSYLGTVSPVTIESPVLSWDGVTLTWADGFLSCEDNGSTFKNYQVSLLNVATEEKTSFETFLNTGILQATEDTRYIAYVKVVCEDEDLWSETPTEAFTTLSIPSTDPLSVSAHAQNSEVVEVTWIPDHNCKAIHKEFVGWSITDLNTDKVLFCDETNDDSNKVRCLVDEGANVHVGVALVCGGHTSQFASADEITVPRSAVEAPTAVVVGDVTDTSVRVSWIQAGVSCDEAGTSFSAWLVQITSPSRIAFSVTKYQDFAAVLTGLTPNTEYSASVSQGCVDSTKNSETVDFTLKTSLATSVSAPSSVKARGTDELAFTQVYNRVFVDVQLGKVTCEQAGSTFTGFEIQTAALNEAGEGMFKTATCSQTAKNGNLFTFRCEVLPGTKYNVRAATNCARANLKSAYSTSSSFATLDETTQSTKLNQVLQDSSTFSDGAKVQMTPATFSDSDGVTGVSFGFVQSTKRSDVDPPTNTTDVGSLEFVFEAVTPSGPRPSGFTQGPIVFRFNTTERGISVEDAKHLTLYYLDTATNTWVNAEATCEKALRQNWVTSDGIWVVATCHLSQYKAFYNGVKPVESSSESVTPSNSTTATVTEATVTQNNQVGGSSNTEVFVGVTTAALIGAIIACILGVLLISAIIILIVWRRHVNKVRKESENTDTEQFEPTIPQGGELGKSVSDLMARDAENSSPQFDKVQRLGLESDEDSAWSSDEENNNGTRV
eukprot:TRINITY_DN564_c0_g1_i1.p1 TRINITY_DN564_c0_g1~~TRINITY_DN564_c0_g1_i1.p1  ORF type:complete len:1157 (-),score=278.17 TRINITY_DN564_c0_g1_i1:234-3704(-)